MTETRDYAVATSAHHEVAEVMECFDADWARKSFTPGEKSHLIWCVENGRQRIDQFISMLSIPCGYRTNVTRIPPSSSSWPELQNEASKST